MPCSVRALVVTCLGENRAHSINVDSEEAVKSQYFLAILSKKIKAKKAD
ncbi:MAG: hypothetical protein ACI9WS_002758 [Paraglaciecola psychrophila]|jgi:hypothetical protein